MCRKYTVITVIEGGRVVDGIERSDESLVANRRGEGAWRRVSEEYEGGWGVGHVIGLRSLARTFKRQQGQ